VGWVDVGLWGELYVPGGGRVMYFGLTVAASPLESPTRGACVKVLGAALEEVAFGLDDCLVLVDRGWEMVRDERRGRRVLLRMSNRVEGSMVARGDDGDDL
jgi:hypothetical protein